MCTLKQLRNIVIVMGVRVGFGVANCRAICEHKVRFVEQQIICHNWTVFD